MIRLCRIQAKRLASAFLPKASNEKEIMVSTPGPIVYDNFFGIQGYWNVGLPGKVSIRVQTRGFELVEFADIWLFPKLNFETLLCETKCREHPKGVLQLPWKLLALLFRGLPGRSIPCRAERKIVRSLGLGLHGGVTLRKSVTLHEDPSLNSSTTLELTNALKNHDKDSFCFLDK